MTQKLGARCRSNGVCVVEKWRVRLSDIEQIWEGVCKEHPNPSFPHRNQVFSISKSGSARFDKYLKLKPAMDLLKQAEHKYRAFRWGSFGEHIATQCKYLCKLYLNTVQPSSLEWWNEATLCRTVRVCSGELFSKKRLKDCKPFFGTRLPLDALSVAYDILGPWVAFCWTSFWFVPAKPS